MSVNIKRIENASIRENADRRKRGYQRREVRKKTIRMRQKKDS